MGYQVASFALAPVLALQGRRVRRVATRLAEPPGPRSACDGTGPPLRVLVLGDSAAAGVGAPSQDAALSGRLVAELRQTFQVSWTVVARLGATTAGTVRHLARRPDGALGTFDVAAVSLGLNDVTGRRPLARWLDDLDALVTLLRMRCAVRHVLLSALPPVDRFPAFPQPLRWYLGITTRRYDHALARWAAETPACEYVPLTLPPGPGMLASDGLHPAPPLYEQWSRELAVRVRARWTPSADGRSASGPHVRGIEP